MRREMGEISAKVNEALLFFIRCPALLLFWTAILTNVFSGIGKIIGQAEVLNFASCKILNAFFNPSSLLFLHL